MYYDLVHRGGGQMTFEIKRMHEKYGPIVRINPEELHIDDPNFYSEIYCNSISTRPIDKSKKFKYRFNIPNVTFSITSVEHQRVRRAAIAPFFSKTRVRKLNDNLKNITERISHWFAAKNAGERIFELKNPSTTAFGNPGDSPPGSPAMHSPGDSNSLNPSRRSGSVASSESGSRPQPVLHVLVRLQN